MAGVPVAFTVVTGGGSIIGASTTTDASGVASVGSWTLGSTLGAQVLAATAQGGANPSTQIAATARPPRWTVLVYMAADNTLATSGVEDIDEMEAAGSNPEVQVVVQAEFSPQQFALEGCTAMTCSNRPNFNTFRYQVTGVGPHVYGPDGQATDIGNRNMTDPAQLAEFVAWGRTNYPAEQYALVLWNHGGGYQGLLEDITSGGTSPMSLGQLRTALSAGPQLDIVDFDMCLMGGYETLVTMQGLAKVASFSEQVEPGAGNPYTAILQALYADPSVNAQGLGGIIVDKYDASYAGGRNSTTRSAYDLSGLATFENALNALAANMSQNLPTLAPTIGTSVVAAQKYSYAMLTDIGDVLDTLTAHSTDATLKGQIAAVKSAALAPNFRLRSRARNGTGEEPVGRSTGLHIVWPSLQGDDVLPSGGPGSFASYQALYNGKAWTQFLAAWIATASTTPYADQGDNRFETYLVWDDAVVSTHADLDLWILEPNGNLYIPFMGTVTPNGHLTSDSYETQSNYEGYLTNRYIEAGRYKFYANLFTDPQNVQPFYDLAYRNDQVSALSWLYGASRPRLSMQTSWQNDPNATYADIEAGAYTDLQYAAYLDVAAPAPVSSNRSPRRSTSTIRITNGLTPVPAIGGNAATSRRVIGGAAEPRITAQQIEAARSYLKLHKRDLRSVAPPRRPRSIVSPFAEAPR